MECVGVIIALISKWYKSGWGNKHRRIGFMMSVFVQGYWATYFLCNNLWWLMAYNILSVCLSVRGIRNNRLKSI
jgi:hypothetical protein